MSEPVTVVGWIEQGKDDLVTSATLWRGLAKQADFLNTEHYEALEEELARIIGDVERLLVAAKSHHLTHRKF